MAGRRTIQWATRVRNHRVAKTIAESTNPKDRDIGTTLESYYRNAGLQTPAQAQHDAKERRRNALEDLADKG